MTLPEKESPAEGQGLDLVGRGDLGIMYSKATSNATADVAVNERNCRSCAALYAYDNGQGECHRYAPKPNFEHSFAVEWPKLTASDFCLEFVARGGE